MRIAFTMALFAASLAATAPPPSSAETVTEQRGKTAIRLELASVPPHSEFARFLREDAAAIADDYVAEEARAVVVTERVTKIGQRFASVLRTSEADLGATNRNIYLEALVWDGATSDFVRLDTFFDAGEPRDEGLILISRHLREVIRTRVWGGKVEPLYLPLVEQATNPDPAVLSNFTLEIGGLAFHYSPFEVAPYEKGPISILVPRDIYAAWLNEAGKAALR